MATTMTVYSRIDLLRDIDTGTENYTNPNLRGSIGSVTSLRESGTTPTADDGALIRSALVAAAKTIDLTAFTEADGATRSLTGKAPRALIFKNRGAAVMTFAKGASNGLDCMSGSWTMALLPGEERVVNLIGVSGVADISGSNKTIDVSGTGTDAFDIGVGVG